MTIDSNGYAPSILETKERCYLCWRCDCKLDRHEIFGASCRKKSKRLGLWVLVCRHCHEKAHKERDTNLTLKQIGQERAETKYQWNHADFRREFGRNYVEVEI